VSKLILLVEDNASDEKLTRLAFQRSGVESELIVVRDGAEALDWIFATGGHEGRDLTVLPTLVLLDLKLPRVGGLEVLRRIRADPRTCVVPVVVLTASREDEDILRSYTLGANAYVQKSVDFMEFAAAAQTISRMWLQLNELPGVGT